jgi:hypothetical protein
MQLGMQAYKKKFAFKAIVCIFSSAKRNLDMRGVEDTTE